MKRARTLIALAALAVVAGLAIWWIRQEAAGPQAADRALVLREPLAPTDPPAPRMELAGPQIAAPQREVVEIALPAALASDSAPSTIHGRLIVIERDGSEMADVDGTLELITWDDGLGTPQKSR